MAHEQGNNPGDDPNKFGLKFDAEKPRWELLPTKQLMKIAEVFNLRVSGLNIKEFNREDLINDIFSEILMYKSDYRNMDKQTILSVIAFKIFFLLRGKPYTDEELKRSRSHLRWDLLSAKDIEGVVNVYTSGAKKYADWNWIKVSKNRYYDALVRHFITVRTSDSYDSELGCLHMHQAIWNVISLMWLEDRDSIPEPIRRAAQKLKGVSPIKVKPLKKKVAKKKAAKKKVVKKKS